MYYILFGAQNCLLASFDPMRIFINEYKSSREYGKLAIKIIRHFLIWNEHFCSFVCALVCSLITSYLFPLEHNFFWFLWSKMAEKTLWKHFVSFGIDERTRGRGRGKHSHQEMNEWIWVRLWMCSGNNKSDDNIFSICMQNSIVIEMGRVTLCCVFRAAVLIHAPYAWMPCEKDWLTNYSRYHHDTPKTNAVNQMAGLSLCATFADGTNVALVFTVQHSVFTEWNSIQIKFDVRSACIGGQHWIVYIVYGIHQTDLIKNW